MARKTRPNPERTYRAARAIAVQVLAEDALDNSDDFLDYVSTQLDGYGEEHINTRTLTVKRLMADPKVKAAFKKFCENVVGSMQYVETELGDF